MCQQQTDQEKQAQEEARKKREKALRDKKRRETEAYKQKYFAYYDDIKISVREDW